MLSTLYSLRMVKTINKKTIILNEKRRSNYQKNKRCKLERAKKELEEIQIQEYTQTKKIKIDEELKRREQNRTKSAKYREKIAHQNAKKM